MAAYFFKDSKKREGLLDRRALYSYTMLSPLPCSVGEQSARDNTLKGRGLCKGEY